MYSYTYWVTFIILLSGKSGSEKMKQAVPKYTQSVAELAFKLSLPNATAHP